MTYYAKSRLSNGRQPTVKEHLAAVKTLAKAYGSEISMEGEAELAGILHDFGKYSDRFKALLNGETHRINHAACGAALLATGFPKHTNLTPVIEAIFAHHDGLVSRGMIWEFLKASVLEEEPLEIGGKEVALAGKKACQEASLLLQTDFQEFPTMLKKLIDKSNSAPGMEQDLELRNFKDMLRSRMLLSCLVDADYCISALDENEKYLEESEKAPPSFKDTIALLQQYVKSVRDLSHADTHLNLLRSQVFDACGAAALMPPGIFTLTAPTGTGKTLALLHFAVRHCDAWDTMNRSILVLPFLTLTEQSADTYKRIIPDLLVDTSQSELSDSARLFSSRWRVPVIITTSVKFFQSLFSDRPSDCRKLHSIANSVILFDESQSLPPELTRATIRSVNELCNQYGCTMVFSTATQPDFSAIPTLENWSSKEILPDCADYYSELKRAKVEWRLDDKEKMDWIQLARELSAQNVNASEKLSQSPVNF